METGNVCCCLCASRTAQCFCICEYPLPPLCYSQECASAHASKKDVLFHYFLPTTAKNLITTRNHRNYLQWVVTLNHTQVKLRKNLSLLDAAVTQIEESYQRQVAVLTALKDQYIERINQLKGTAAEAFNYAINETALNAVNNEYIPQSDITQWIWIMANKAEDDDTSLFQFDIREIGEGELGEMFTVKVNSVFQSLSAWHMKFPIDRKSVYREELESLKVTAAALEERSKKSEGIIEILDKDVKRCKEASERLLAEMIEKKPVSDNTEERKAEDKPKKLVAISAEVKASSSNPKLPVKEEVKLISVRPKIEKISKASFGKSLPLPQAKEFIKTHSPLSPQPAERQKTPLSAERQKTPLPAERQKTSHCITCSVEFTHGDVNLHCPNYCQCKPCLIETVIGQPNRRCYLCNEELSLWTINMIKESMRRCHVCGIALPLKIFDASASCSVCLCCVEIDNGTAKCTKCDNSTFFLRGEDKEWLRTTPIKHACCPNAEGILYHSKLLCGHKVCKVHEATLLVCRVCRYERKRYSGRRIPNKR